MRAAQSNWTAGLGRNDLDQRIQHSSEKPGPANVVETEGWQAVVIQAKGSEAQCQFVGVERGVVVIVCWLPLRNASPAAVAGT